MPKTDVSNGNGHRSRASKARILVVEDEKDLSRILQYNLKRAGYQVWSAPSGEQGLKLFRRYSPDLVVLDIMLPGMDGLEFCRIVREKSSSPVLFLTAKKSETDRVVGLKLGGDDYVTKPFFMSELLARIEVLLRRKEPKPGKEGQAPLRVGELEVDFERHEVRVQGKNVVLTPTEFRFLKLMIEADGKVLSRDTFLSHIWGHDAGQEMNTRAVDQHMARLRRKLGPESARVATVTNLGYRFKSD